MSCSTCGAGSPTGKYMEEQQQMAAAGVERQSAVKSREKETYFTRFTTGQRIEHVVLMVSFTILAVTGLAQRYSGAGWAEWTILRLGGIEYTRLIHRGFALVFTLGAVYHGANVLYSYFVKHRRLTMVPTLKDFRDVVDTLRYTFGFIDKHPRFGRFDYRQKFEYWGLLFGGTVIILTGFVLAFPVAVTRFLPGQVVAAAVEFHGFEATLAALTIVVWHLYDVIFRPGVFPADTSIFTGRVSLERLREEHPLEYAEVMGTPPETTGEIPAAPSAGQEAGTEPGPQTP
jgi:formate dehydrogenase subunit gamma